MELYSEEKARLYEELEHYIIRDEETDEIIGLAPDAPDNVKKAYGEMIAEMNSDEPVVRR